MSFPSSTELQQTIDELERVRARMRNMANIQNEEAPLGSIVYNQMMRVAVDAADGIRMLEDLKERAVWLETINNRK